jgi:hypothetical protein
VDRAASAEAQATPAARSPPFPRERSIEPRGPRNVSDFPAAPWVTRTTAAAKCGLEIEEEYYLTMKDLPMTVG